MTAAQLRVLISALAFALAVTSAHGAESEAETIVALRKVGATVTRDERAQLQPVTGVHFNYSRVPAGTLALLGTFAELQSLDLSGTFIPGPELDALVGLKKLRVLKLRENDLRPAGLVRLARLISLEELDLRHTGFTALELRDIDRGGLRGGNSEREKADPTEYGASRSRAIT
jgi:hypothetical protein